MGALPQRHARVCSTHVRSRGSGGLSATCRSQIEKLSNLIIDTILTDCYDTVSSVIVVVYMSYFYVVMSNNL